MLEFHDILSQLSGFPDIVMYPLQAHHEAVAHAEVEISLWDRVIQSRLIPILIVLAILGWAAGKMNIPSSIEKQRNQIAGEVEALERQKQQALAQMNEVKQRTDRLSEEVEEILRGARQQAETLSTQILTDAKTEATKIVDNSRKRVAIEQRSAIKSLEKRMLEEALSDARVELARNLTADDQRRSVDAFLAELSTKKGAK